MAFKKGKSGNPGGRPKETHDVKLLAREHTAEAIERLVEWMRSDNAKASVSACNAILNRGYGTPAQSMELTGKDGDALIPDSTSEFDKARLIAHVLSSAMHGETRH